MIFGLIVLCVAGVARVSASTPLILISLDAFRWDYCTLHAEETPRLRKLAATGVSARGLVPVFPSNTFPNHYAIVTGLYPAHHRMVNNDFFDADSGMLFHSNQPVSVRDPRWWGGEPIWVTAIKQGRNAAASFWAGSETEIGGVRPTFWHYYDYSIPFEKRLDELAGWMRLPLGERPDIVAFYLEEANSAGHAFGPSSPELVAALKLLDTRVGAIVDRLAAEGAQANFVIVSDHGMTPVIQDNVMILEDYLELRSVQIDFEGSVCGLRPLQGDEAELLQRLARVPHAKAYRAEDLPARFHIAPGPRIPPVWVLPDEGCHVISRAGYKKQTTRYAGGNYLRGDHGYDPNLPSMHGVLIANGPSFRSGVELPECENIHIYNLLCAAIGLKAAANDGDDRLSRAALRGP